MNIFEILKSQDSDNPILKVYQVKEELTNDCTSESAQPVVANTAHKVADPVNIEDTFNFVGKSLAKSYRRGEISAKELLRSYRKNVAEAEPFALLDIKSKNFRKSFVLPTIQP